MKSLISKKVDKLDLVLSEILLFQESVISPMLVESMPMRDAGLCWVPRNGQCRGCQPLPATEPRAISFISSAPRALYFCEGLFPLFLKMLFVLADT